MKDKYVKVCPRCGSTNIVSGGVGLSGVSLDSCGDCGYRNMLSSALSSEVSPILEIEKSQLDNFRKRIKKNSIVK